MALLVVIGVLCIFLADGVSCGSKRFISSSELVYNDMFTLPQDANAQRIVRRDTSRFERDEVGWTNINEEVDMAIEKIWPLISSGSYSTLALPNMTETISVRTLFITNSAGLRLSNGHLYNIQGIQRHGDAFMTYSDKSFQFRSDILIRSLQFAYDFAVDIIVIGVSGSLDGVLQDVLVSGDFSVSAEDATISLNAFKIKSFGDIAIRLKEYPIILLRPITNLFRDRITTTMSDAVKTQLQGLIAEVNNEDRLELKKFLNNTLAGLTG